MVILFHFSLQCCRGSVRQRADLLHAALFISFHGPLIGFRSGLWLGGPEMLIIFFRSCFFVDLICALGCYGAGMWNFSSQLSNRRLQVFVPTQVGIWSYLWVPLSWLEPRSHIRMLPPACFTVGMGFFGRWTVLSLVCAPNICSESSTLDRCTMCHMVWGDWGLRCVEFKSQGWTVLHLEIIPICNLMDVLWPVELELELDPLMVVI